MQHRLLRRSRLLQSLQDLRAFAVSRASLRVRTIDDEFCFSFTRNPATQRRLAILL